ncbi:hypothetical protein MMC28_003322 [Mycoblastus sanguinarius]|nr:hypothetical protein [Mycoblastus sanguinarius]
MSDSSLTSIEDDFIESPGDETDPTPIEGADSQNSVETEKDEAVPDLVHTPDNDSDDPIGYPFKDYDPSKPFRFLELDVEVKNWSKPSSTYNPNLWYGTIREKVLGFILERAENISPYYNCGSVQVSYLATQDKENYDTSIIVAAVGNKPLLDEATGVLYGENLWTFRNPKVASWWLERIGSNVQKIQSIHFRLSGGLETAFMIRVESRWYNLFEWLRPRHKFYEMFVSFRDWNKRGLNTEDPEERSDHDPINNPLIWGSRQAVLKSLVAFRDLTEVHIDPGPFVTRQVTRILERAMVLKKGDVGDEEIINLARSVEHPYAFNIMT